MLTTESIHSKVKFHMNALETHVKNGNIFLNQRNRLLDSILIDSFIEKYYHFMVYHFLALKIQLERFGNSTEEMERKGFVGNFTDDASYKRERKRPEEHRNRVKALRSSKAGSLKYILQWENLTKSENGENVFKNVPMREKFENISLAGIPEDDNITEDVSKVMVTKRVQLFEGYRKPKRVSSTMGAFLENTYEKTKIRSILEKLDEEDEDVRNSKKLSDSLINYKAIFDQNLPQTTDEKERIQKVMSVTEKLNDQDVRKSKIKASDSSLNYEVVFDQTLCKHTDQEKNIYEVGSTIENLQEENKADVRSSKIEEDTSINSKGSVTNDFSLTANKTSNQATRIFPENENETDEVKQFPHHIEIENCTPTESVCTKPRIVQVHYKQDIPKNFLP